MLFGLYKYKETSANGRLLIWQVSANMIKNKPFIGYGIDGFQRNYMESQASYFQKNQKSTYALLADNNKIAFNEFIRIWVEQGFFGLIFFIFLIYYALIPNENLIGKIFSKDKTLITARATLIILIVFGFFSYPFSLLQFQLLFVFSIAVISSKYPSVIQANFIPIKYRNTTLTSLYLSITCLIVINVKVRYRHIYHYADAYIKWNNSLMAYHENPNAAINKLKDVYPFFINNPDYLYTYGKMLNMTNQCHESIKFLKHAAKICPSYDTFIELGLCYEKTGELLKAESCWSKAVTMIPARFKPEYLLAEMYFKTGDLSNAKLLTNKLLNRKPKLYTPEVYDLINEIKQLDQKINYNISL